MFETSYNTFKNLNNQRLPVNLQRLENEYFLNNLMVSGNDFISASTQESLMKIVPTKSSNLNLLDNAKPISAWVSIRKPEQENRNQIFQTPLISKEKTVDKILNNN